MLLFWMRTMRFPSAVKSDCLLRERERERKGRKSKYEKLTSSLSVLPCNISQLFSIIPGESTHFISPIPLIAIKQEIILSTTNLCYDLLLITTRNKS